MLLTNIFSKSQRQENQLRIEYSKVWQLVYILLLVVVFSTSQSGYAKEKRENNITLPPAPETGSPEGDFSAGGTRGNKPRNFICGDKSKNISYLLGNRNREFTLSAYPSFWFYISNKINETTQIKFVVSELKTGNKVYDRVIQGTNKAGIIGITLPKDKKYALSSEENYSWSLIVDCAGTYEKSETILTGWLTRLSSDSELQQQLATASEAEKHTVYLKHNLLYDALEELALSRITKPDNIEIKKAWNKLLIKLGWEDLAQQKSLFLTK